MIKKKRYNKKFNIKYKKKLNIKLIKINLIKLIKLNFRVCSFILKKGKLSKASLFFDKILLILIKSLHKNPFIVLNKAIKNVSPLFLLKNKKFGKRIIVSPVFIISRFTRTSLGIKWIIEAALRRTGTGNFYDNLVLEIKEAFNNKGFAKKKLKNLNSLVIENRANIRFRW